MEDQLKEAEESIESLIEYERSEGERHLKEAKSGHKEAIRVRVREKGILKRLNLDIKRHWRRDSKLRSLVLSLTLIGGIGGEGN